jgi:hypothetical protein
MRDVMAGLLFQQVVLARPPTVLRKKEEATLTKYLIFIILYIYINLFQPPVHES